MKLNKWILKLLGTVTVLSAGATVVSCGFFDLFNSSKDDEDNKQNVDNGSTNPSDHTDSDTGDVIITPSDPDLDKPDDINIPPIGRDENNRISTKVIRREPNNLLNQPNRKINGNFNNVKFNSVADFYKNNVEISTKSNEFDSNLPITEAVDKWELRTRNIINKFNPIYLNMDQINQYISPINIETSIIGFKVADINGNVLVTLKNGSESRNVSVPGFLSLQNYFDKLVNESTSNSDKVFSMFWELKTYYVKNQITKKNVKDTFIPKNNDHVSIENIDYIEGSNELIASSVNSNPNLWYYNFSFKFDLSLVINGQKYTQKLTLKRPVIVDRNIVVKSTKNKDYADFNSSYDWKKIIQNNLMNNNGIIDSQNTTVIWNNIQKYFSFQYDPSFTLIGLKYDVTNGKKTHFISIGEGKNSEISVKLIFENKITNEQQIGIVILDNFFQDRNFNITKNISLANFKFKDYRNYYKYTPDKLVTLNFDDLMTIKFKEPGYDLLFKKWNKTSDNKVELWTQLRNKSTNELIDVQRPIILPWVKIPNYQNSTVNSQWFNMSQSVLDNYQNNIDSFKNVIDNLNISDKIKWNSVFYDSAKNLSNLDGLNINSTNIDEYIRLEFDAISGFAIPIFYDVELKKITRELTFSIGFINKNFIDIKDPGIRITMSIRDNDLDKKRMLQNSVDKLRYNDLVLKKKNSNYSTATAKGKMLDFVGISTNFNEIDWNRYDYDIVDIITIEDSIAFRIRVFDPTLQGSGISATSNNWFLVEGFNYTNPTITNKTEYLEEILSPQNNAIKSTYKENMRVFTKSGTLSSVVINESKQYLQDTKNKFLLSYDVNEINKHISAESYSLQVFYKWYEATTLLNKNPNILSYNYFDLTFSKDKLNQSKSKKVNIGYFSIDKNSTEKVQIYLRTKDQKVLIEFIFSDNIESSNRLLETFFNNKTNAKFIINSFNSNLYALNLNYKPVSRPNVVNSVFDNSDINNFRYKLNIKDSYSSDNLLNPNMNDKTAANNGFIPNYSNYIRNDVPRVLGDNMMRTFAENGTYWMLSKVKPNDPTDERYYVATNIHVVAKDGQSHTEPSMYKKRALNTIRIPFYDPTGYNISNEFEIPSKTISVQDFWRATNQTSKNGALKNSQEDIAVVILDVKDIKDWAIKNSKQQIYNFFNNWKNLSPISFSDKFVHASGVESNFIEPLFMSGFPDRKYDMIQLNRLSLNYTHGKEIIKSGENSNDYYSINSVYLSVNSDHNRPLLIIPGSSGTLVTDRDGNAIGILNAGSPDRVSIRIFDNTLFNYIGYDEVNDPLKDKNNNSFVDKVIKQAIEDPNNYEIIQIAKSQWK